MALWSGQWFLVPHLKLFESSVSACHHLRHGSQSRRDQLPGNELGYEQSGQVLHGTLAAPFLSQFRWSSFGGFGAACLCALFRRVFGSGRFRATAIVGLFFLLQNPLRGRLVGDEVRDPSPLAAVAQDVADCVRHRLCSEGARRN